MEDGSQRTASRFRTTSWTLIARARSSRGDLETLLDRYWSPVYAFLRRSGRDPHDAADVTQAFLSDIVMGRDLIGRADSARGRFRSFLITALKRFEIDEFRKEHGRNAAGKRRAVVFGPQDPDSADLAEPRSTDDPTSAFDRQWATTVLNTALGNVEQDCRDDGMHSQWEAFEARVLRPVRDNCQQTPIEDVVDSLGVKDQQKVYSMVQTVKRKIQRELREVVAETVQEPEEVELELRELGEFLKLSR